MRLSAALAALMAASSAAAFAGGTYDWTEITPKLTNAQVSGVVVHPLDGRKLLVRGSFQIGDRFYPSVSSNDGGASWAPTTGEARYLSDIATHVGLPGTLFADARGYIPPFRGIAPPEPGAPGQVFRSDDFGGTWALVNVAMEEGQSFVPFGSDPTEVRRLFSLVTKEGGCGVIYPGCRYTTAIGIGVSHDSGRTWALSPGMASTQLIQEIDVEPPVASAPKRMFAVTNDSVYVTRDSAATWSRIDPATIGTVRAIRADPRRSNVLYAIRQPRDATAGDLVRSDDEGASWKVIFVYSDYTPRLLVDPERPDELWLSGLAAGVQHSADGGRSWSNLGFEGPMSPAGPLVLNPADAGSVLLVQGTRLYRGTPSVRRDPVIDEFRYEADRYWDAVLPGEARSQDYRMEPGEVRRTGSRFGAWRADDAPAGALGSCRFQGVPARGQHSRFITLQGA